MKILVVQTSILVKQHEFFVHSATKKFIDNLQRHGHEVKISGSVIDKFNEGINIDRINPDLVCVFQRHYYGLRSLISYAFSFIKSFSYIKKYDFIYLFMPGHYPMLLGFACLLLGKKTGIYLRVGNRAFNLPNKLLYRRSYFAFATGKGLTEKISKYVKSEEVIPLLDFHNKNGISHQFSSSFNVIFVGRVCLKKGVDSLLAAFQDKLIKERDIHLHIVGDGDEGLKVLAKQLTNVTFHGVVSDRKHLFSLLHSADVFCLPSLWEGFPRVLYEAAFSKCALLTTFVGAVSSMLVENSNCLKLEQKDVVSIVNNIVSLYDDPELLKTLQNNAFMFYKDKFENIKEDHSDQFLRAVKNV